MESKKREKESHNTHETIAVGVNEIREKNRFPKNLEGIKNLEKFSEFF